MRRRDQGLLKVAISIGVSSRNRRSHSLCSGHALPVEAISLPKFGIAAIRDCGNQGLLRQKPPAKKVKDCFTPFAMTVLKFLSD
jgi:hypothetical protein